VLLGSFDDSKLKQHHDSRDQMIAPDE